MLSRISPLALFISASHKDDLELRSPITMLRPKPAIASSPFIERPLTLSYESNQNRN
jgi:hypothetical protein